MATSNTLESTGLEYLDSSISPAERPNIVKRFWNTITKTAARRFATAVVAGLILSALVVGLMFAMPYLMMGLTMLLGSAAIWLLPTTFAAQIAVFTGVITAAVTLTTTFFWGVGELLGLAVAKCRENSAYRSGEYTFAEPTDFASASQAFAPSASSTTQTIVDSSDDEADSSLGNSEAERAPVDPDSEHDEDTPPTEVPPTPPANTPDQPATQEAQNVVRISTLFITNPGAANTAPAEEPLTPVPGGPGTSS